MVHALGKRRLKWTPDWPVSLPRASAHDNLPTRTQGGKGMHIALCSAFMLALVLARFHHSAFGF